MDSHSVQCEAGAVAQDLRTVSGGLDIDRYEDILIYRDTQKVDNIFVSLDFTILPKTCFLVQPAPCKTMSIISVTRYGGRVRFATCTVFFSF